MTGHRQSSASSKNSAATGQQQHPTKYVLVTGGVISGIGKGIIASSTGLLLKTMGFSVTAIKIDPYLNIDAGLLSPLDHGEVYTLDDGGEVDLDLGNYERFLDIKLTRDNNITTGKVYQQVIKRERDGGYLGKTVQVVPHVTDGIQDWVDRVAQIPVDSSDNDGEPRGKPDVCVIELGGTVGDIESAPFIEAMRQFQFRVGHDNFCLIHVSLVPVVGSVGEQKTKPTQSSVRDLRGLGLSPDMIVCRSTTMLEEGIKDKISMFCHVPASQVFAVHDCPTLYHVPLLLHKQGLLDVLTSRLHLGSLQKALPGSRVQAGRELFQKWSALARSGAREHEPVRIAVVGKYTYLKDSYASLVKALEHASFAAGRQLVIKWVEATDLERPAGSSLPLPIASSGVDAAAKIERGDASTGSGSGSAPSGSSAAKFFEAWQNVCTADGVLVPGGFGDRGIEGKIAATQWARENNVPFLGICLGLQMATVEFARNVCGITNATSEEFVKDPAGVTYAVVHMPEISRDTMGANMRLGMRATLFEPDTESFKIRKLYGNAPIVHERHRHRYEVNPELVAQLEAAGMKYIGRDDKGQRMQVLELPAHKYFVATQYHPEYLSRPLHPSPPFLGLILAASGQLDDHLAGKPIGDHH